MFLASEETQEMIINLDGAFIPERGRGYRDEVYGVADFYNFVDACEFQCPESDEVGNIDHNGVVKV